MKLKKILPPEHNFSLFFGEIPMPGIVRVTPTLIPRDHKWELPELIACAKFKALGVDGPAECHNIDFKHHLSLHFNLD